MIENNPFYTLQIRDTLLELICEVADCLKQSELTIHLSVEYMDRYLLIRHKSFAPVSSSLSDMELVSNIFESHSLDAVAITCILLASKFDEIDDNIPLIDEFCRAHTLVRDSIENGYLATQNDRRSRFPLGRSYPGYIAVQRCELYLLELLCWDLNTITPMHLI